MHKQSWSVPKFFVREDGYTMVEYGLMVALVGAVSALGAPFAEASIKSVDSGLVAPAVVVLVATLIAAWTDLWKFKVENALTIPLMATGLIYQTWAAGAGGALGSLLGMLLGGLPLLALYSRGAMGAGDVKLMAGIGAWLGPWGVLHVMFFSGFVTGCFAAGRALWHRIRPQTVSVASSGAMSAQAAGSAHPEEMTGSWMDHLQAGRRRIPFAVMIVPGTVCALLWIARVG